MALTQRHASSRPRSTSTMETQNGAATPAAESNGNEVPGLSRRLGALKPWNEENDGLDQRKRSAPDDRADSNADPGNKRIGHETNESETSASNLNGTASGDGHSSEDQRASTASSSSNPFVEASSSTPCAGASLDNLLIKGGDGHASPWVAGRPETTTVSPRTSNGNVDSGQRPAAAYDGHRAASETLLPATQHLSLSINARSEGSRQQGREFDDGRHRASAKSPDVDISRPRLRSPAPTDLDVLAMVTVTSPPLPDNPRRRPPLSTRTLRTPPMGSAPYFPNSVNRVLMGPYAFGAAKSVPRIVSRDAKLSRAAKPRTRQQKQQDAGISDGDSSDTISEDEEVWQQRSARARHRLQQERVLASLDDSGSDPGLVSPAHNGLWQSPTPGARHSNSFSAYPPDGVFDDQDDGGPTEPLLMYHHSRSALGSPRRLLSAHSLVSPLRPRLAGLRDSNLDYGSLRTSRPSSTTMMPPTPGVFFESLNTRRASEGAIKSPVSASVLPIRGSHQRLQRGPQLDSRRGDGINCNGPEPEDSGGETTETDEECAAMAFSPVPRRRRQKRVLRPGSDLLSQIDPAEPAENPAYSRVRDGGLMFPQERTTATAAPISAAIPARRGDKKREVRHRPNPLVFPPSMYSTASSSSVMMEPVAGDEFESVHMTPRPYVSRGRVIPASEPHTRRRRNMRDYLDVEVQAPLFEAKGGKVRAGHYRRSEGADDDLTESDTDQREDAKRLASPRMERTPSRTGHKFPEPTTPGYRFERRGSGDDSGDTTETDVEVQAQAHRMRAVHYSVKPSRRLRRELAQIRDREQQGDDVYNPPRPLQLISPARAPRIPGQDAMQVSRFNHHGFSTSTSTAFPPIISSVRSRVGSPTAQSPPPSPPPPPPPPQLSAPKGELLPPHGDGVDMGKEAAMSTTEKRKRALTAPSRYDHSIHINTGVPSADDIGAAQALASLSPQATKVYLRIPLPPPPRSPRMLNGRTSEQEMGRMTLLRVTNGRVARRSEDRTHPEWQQHGHYEENTDDGSLSLSREIGRRGSLAQPSAYLLSGTTTSSSEDNLAEGGSGKNISSRGVESQQSRKRRRRSSLIADEDKEYEEGLPCSISKPSVSLGALSRRDSSPMVGTATGSSRLEPESEFPVLVPSERPASATTATEPGTPCI